MEFNSNAAAPSDSPADPMADLSAAQLAQLASEQLNMADSFFAGFEAITSAGPSAPPPSGPAGAVPPPSRPVGPVPPPPSGPVGPVPPPPSGPIGPVPPPPSGPVGPVPPPPPGMGIGAEAATPVARRRPQASEKKSRGRPKGSVNKPKLRPVDLASNDSRAAPAHVPSKDSPAAPTHLPSKDSFAAPARIDFQAHALVVAPGEDVAMRLSSFAQEMSPRTIFVMSVVGAVSSSVLSQPIVSSCGILRNDNIYPLQHISGTCSVHTKMDGVYKRNGTFHACLANDAGQTIGGQIAGPLIAAHPVMIVVGSFIIQDVDETKCPVDESTPRGPSGGGDDASGAPQAIPTI